MSQIKRREKTDHIAAVYELTIADLIESLCVETSLYLTKYTFNVHKRKKGTSIYDKKKLFLTTYGPFDVYD